MTTPTRQPRVVDFHRGECPPLGGETGGERSREARVHRCRSKGMIDGVDPKGDLARSIFVRSDPTRDLASAASIPTPDPKGDLAPPILVRPDPKGDLAPRIRVTPKPQGPFSPRLRVRPDPKGDLAPRILVAPDSQSGFSPPETICGTTLGGRHRGLRPVGDYVDRSSGVRDREYAGHAGFAGGRSTPGRLSDGRHPGSRPLHGSEHARRVGREPTRAERSLHLSQALIEPGRGPPRRALRRGTSRRALVRAHERPCR
jgi:hypothetical protein